MRRIFYVYIMMNDRGTTLYTGVTNDLVRRLTEHRTSDSKSFTSLYRTSRLVWFESHSTIQQAISREKQIKGWRRTRKEALIRASNPHLKDLSEEAARAVAEMEFRLL